MRFSLAYYLLLLYTTVIIKPLLPIAADAWDHAFAEAKHIATVHARYGKNHLEKEISSETSHANSKNSDTLKGAEPIQFHLSNINDYQVFNSYDINNNFTSFQPQKLPFIFTLILAPPPRQLSRIPAYKSGF